ncbi:hypothetical protein ISCGN_007483 [Ixodes scapularis]
MAERRSGPAPPGLRRYREPGSRQACAARGRAVRSNIAAPGRAVRDGAPAPRGGSVYDRGTCLESAPLPHRGHVDGVGGRRGGPLRFPPALETSTQINAWPARPPSPTPVPWPHAAGGATGLGSA